MTAVALLPDAHAVSDDATPYPIPVALWQRIGRERTARKMTKKALAEAAGVSFGFIAQIERGDIKSSTHLPKICAELAIDWVEYLVPEELQRRVLRALERARIEGGEDVAMKFAEEAETLSRRMVADSRSEGPSTARRSLPSPSR